MAGDWQDVPYVQAAGDGGARTTTQVVVIHATDNTASAANEAKYASYRSDQTSAHFFVDSSAIYQCVPLSHIAYGCLYHGNRISVQFELCGLSGAVSDAVLRKAAGYVRRVCDRYGIPIRKVDASQVRGGAKGICGHADITAAFPEDEGTHTDPGAFDWATFIGYVGGTMGSTADNWAKAYSQGVAEYATDTGAKLSNEPVKWRIPDEAWQKSVDARLADLAAKVGAPAPVDPAVLDAAVAKALAGQTTLTADEIKAAVKAALREGAGS